MNKRTFAVGTAALALAATVAGVAAAQQHHSGHGSGPMMMADPFGNATITRAEAQAKAGEMFARLDGNRDGKLDRSDREARKEAFLAERFAGMDTNKDGKLDRAEFMAGHQRPAAGRSGPGMMERGMGMKHMRAMMGQMDGNADRALTRDEFVTGALKHFDAADANKDGKLTPEERRAAMHARMGGKGRMHAMDHDAMTPRAPASAVPQ